MMESENLPYTRDDCTRYIQCNEAAAATHTHRRTMYEKVCTYIKGHVVSVSVCVVLSLTLLGVLTLQNIYNTNDTFSAKIDGVSMSHIAPKIVHWGTKLIQNPQNPHFDLHKNVNKIPLKRMNSADSICRRFQEGSHNCRTTEKYIKSIFGDEKYGENEQKSDTFDENDFNSNELIGFYTNGGGSDISIHDYRNAQYYIDIYIGTPAKRFSVIVDTGSADLWVPSSACGLSCGFHNRFDDKKSSTNEVTAGSYNITYGSGDVKGYMTTDRVTLGDISLDEYMFGEVTSAKGLGFAYIMGKFDGILGLAFPRISTHNITPVFDMMVQRKLVQKNMFAIYFGDDHGNGAELVLGGVDKSHFTGNILWLPSKNDFWRVKLQSVTCGDVDISAGGMAIIDSGTSLITGPSKEITLLAETLGASSVPLSHGEYYIDCEKGLSGPPVTIWMADTPFTLQPKDYLIPVAKGQCLLAFMALDLPETSGVSWILGDVFMRQYYCIFDYDGPSVGFAKVAKHA